MILVFDASVAVKTFVREAQSEVATEIFAEAERLIVPAHFLAEVGEVMVRHRRAGEVSLHQVQFFPGVWPWRFVVVPLEELFDEAFDIAIETGASFYDALYIAAAERRDAMLVTADQRLLRRMAGTPWAGRAMSLADWEVRSGPVQ